MTLTGGVGERLKPPVLKNREAIIPEFDEDASLEIGSRFFVFSLRVKIFHDF